jgi:hypothetical protein
MRVEEVCCTCNFWRESDNGTGLGKCQNERASEQYPSVTNYSDNCGEWSKASNVFDRQSYNKYYS